MLLKTRFYIPPLRKQSVLRQALINKLNESSGGELVLVSAPAGYGKTTIVSQWLHSNPHTFTWLVVDQSQSVPTVFWEYVINALQTIQPKLGEEAMQILKGLDDQQLEPVVISLLNDLDGLSILNNAEQPITLVLDDFHLLESQATLILMNLFLDHIPPSIRLVLITRIEPALALARRRANNQLQELDVDDLAFSREEGRRFFNDTMALSLSDADIFRLCNNSEGWVVGLQLAALSLQKSSTKVAIEKPSLDRHISDYLFEEVYSLQSRDLQEFLMISACVSRFCAGLCNELVPTQDSLKLISLLDQSNLFLVSLDNHRTWFRYHDLFRQFLLHQFSQLSKQRRDQYYRRAAQWFEAAGYLEEALEQFILQKNWQEAIRLLEQITEDKIQQGHKASLINWIEMIPSKFRDHLSLSEIKAEAYTKELGITPEAGEPQNPESMSSSIKSSTIEALTRRETQVKKLVSQGMPNKQIASELNISLNTLKVHIRNLYGKMGVENRTQALIKMNQQSKGETP